MTLTKEDIKEGILVGTDERGEQVVTIINSVKGNLVSFLSPPKKTKDSIHINHFRLFDDDIYIGPKELVKW